MILTLVQYILHNQILLLQDSPYELKAVQVMLSLPETFLEAHF